MAVFLWAYASSDADSNPGVGPYGPMPDTVDSTESFSLVVIVNRHAAAEDCAQSGLRLTEHRWKSPRRLPRRHNRHARSARAARIADPTYSLRLFNDGLLSQSVEKHVWSFFDDQQATVLRLDEAFLYGVIDQPHERIIISADVQQSGQLVM